jgi:hypothetical protein
LAEGVEDESQLVRLDPDARVGNAELDHRLVRLIVIGMDPTGQRNKATLSEF